MTNTREFAYGFFIGNTTSKKVWTLMCWLVVGALCAPNLARAADTPILQWTEAGNKYEVFDKKDNVFLLKGDSLNGKNLSGSGSDFSIMAKGQLVKGVSGKNNEWIVKDGKGVEIGKIVFSGENYELFQSGTSKFRVKIKEDKFNFYGPGDQRLGHGKAKPDGFSVNYEDSRVGVEKIKGAKSLKEASFLVLPIGAEERVLFWALERKP